MPKLQPSAVKPKELPTVQSEQLSLAEALGILRFLDGRKVLCTKCGYKLATKRNTYHEACDDCASTSMQSFNDKPKAGALDEILCKKLSKWADAMFKGDG